MQKVPTRTEVFRAGVDEVHESGTPIKLGEEHGGICLRLRTFYPLKTRFYAAVFAAAFSKNPTPIATHPHCYLYSVWKEKENGEEVSWLKIGKRGFWNWKKGVLYINKGFWIFRGGGGVTRGRSGLMDRIAVVHFQQNQVFHIHGIGGCTFTELVLIKH